MKCVRVEIRVEKCTLWSELEVSLDSFLFKHLLNVQEDIFLFPLFSFAFRRYSELFKAKLKLMLITFLGECDISLREL